MAIESGRVNCFTWPRIPTSSPGGHEGPSDAARRETRQAPRASFGEESREKLRGRLLHREERPTLERNIIDTSEKARANYRYVIGQHFGLVNIYERGQRTCNSLADIFNACVSSRLSTASMVALGDKALLATRSTPLIFCIALNNCAYVDWIASLQQARKRSSVSRFCPHALDPENDTFII